MDLSKLKLTEDATGVRLSIKAVPGASRTRIVGELGGALKVAVAAAPERGRANRAIIQLLAEQLGIAEAQIQITRGHTTARKEVAIARLSVAEVFERLSR